MNPPPEPDWPAVLLRWSVEPAVVLLLAVTVAVYVHGVQARSRGVEARSRRGQGPDGGGTGRFAAGLAVVAGALLSPLATYADALLSVHMVQHLLLVLVAAPLLVGARPGETLLAGLPARVTSGLRRIGRSGLGRVLTSPVVAWTVFAAVGWAVHFTSLFDLALEEPLVHAAEHLVFLGSGLLFWVPVLGTRPMSHPARLLYLALAMPQNTFLALAIFSAGGPLYDSYERLARTWGPSVLDDQRQGGGIMWMAGDLVLLVAVLLVAAGWAKQDLATEEE